MFIQTVTFTVPMQQKREFTAKLAKDARSLDQSLCMAHEVWVNEQKEKLEFTVVSKWPAKADFQTWLGRPEHLEEHRQMAAAKKQQSAEEASEVTKTMKSYQLFEMN